MAVAANGVANNLPDALLPRRRGKSVEAAHALE
jgi:hypothetical protein